MVAVDTQVKPRTRAELFERRTQMADAIRNGAALSEVARSFQVSFQTVKNACVENNVLIPRNSMKAIASKTDGDVGGNYKTSSIG